MSRKHVTSALGGAVVGAAVAAVIAQASHKTMQSRVDQAIRNRNNLQGKIETAAKQVAEAELRVQHAQDQSNVLRIPDIRAVYEQDSKEDFLQCVVDFHTGVKGKVVLARKLNDDGYAVNIDNGYKGSCSDTALQEVVRRFDDIGEDCLMPVTSWTGTSNFPVALLEIHQGDNIAAEERNTLVLEYVDKIRKAKVAASPQEIRRARCLIYLMLVRVWQGPEQRESDIAILNSSLQTRSAQRLLSTFCALKYQDCAVTNVQGIHDEVKMDKTDRMALIFAYKALDGAPRKFTTFF